MTATSAHSRLDAKSIAYPTVVAWPPDSDDAAIVDLLMRIGVFDPASVRLIVARTPPTILGCYNDEQSRAIVDAIRQAGGDAFAPSLDDLSSLGPTMKIRDMRLADGHLEVDIWRGLSTTIRRDRVQFLVRGRVSRSAESDRARRVAEQVRENVESATRFTRYGWAARFAAERNINRIRDDVNVSRSITELLDIHLPNGSVFQVDGDRFAFAILGDRKGHADKINMDLLTELIAHISPDEVVDTYFELFRPPPGHHRLMQRVPEMRRQNEDAAFAFYSRWSALLYRHVMGLSRS